jgi:hypothetical protein
VSSPLSSNGKTPDFDSGNRGSSPCDGTDRVSSNGRTADSESENGGSSPPIRTWLFEREAAREPAKPRRGSHIRPRSTLVKGTQLALSLKLARADIALALEELDAFDQTAPRHHVKAARESIAAHLELAARHMRDGL